MGRGGEHSRCAARAPCGSNGFTARPITCTCGRSVSLLGSRLSTSRSMLRIFCSGPCTQREHGRSARRPHPSTRASSRVGACLCELRLPFGEKRGERREEVPQKVAARRREPVSAAQGSAGQGTWCLARVLTRTRSCAQSQCCPSSPSLARAAARPAGWGRPIFEHAHRSCR